MKLIESGRIPRDEPICVCITGNGLKTVEVMSAHGGLTSSPVIPAKLAEFDRLVEQIDESGSRSSATVSTAQGA
jgi:threonine synthase